MNDLLVNLIVTFVLLLPVRNWGGCFLKRRILKLVVTDAWAKEGRVILPSSFREHPNPDEVPVGSGLTCSCC